MFLFSLWYYSKIIKKACFQYSIFWFINKLKTIKLIYKFMRNTTHKESIHLVYPSLTKKGAIYIGNLNAAKNFEILKGSLFLTQNIIQEQSLLPLKEHFQTIQKTFYQTIFISQLMITNNLIFLNILIKPLNSSIKH